ncbi:2,4-dienoyl-CoA reductase-like NADH-dependent reductase (Old Yellow Enzyme family) [Actinocorallia herbida]|uniref:2,4-dienoyl-CoA reductase-like NADH-dependent reductase (Old Yellow Enzyme family) n=1 Tax=Actinocorallia herbida TaxID=58109 RepID=A0A3N1CUU3_9ACTN|nr:NADH:flavin oxidoreductase [Actinocorallia herbida]ROO85070.1 2,4-dienoyl-CoA reductase-like NADH-dependent reductase (Old Yellow Enzyme family) [Actinocorallia herbida]
MSQIASPDALAAPLVLGRGPAWPNRFAVAPLTNLQSPDGVLSEDEYAWLVRRAEGGFGMVMTCAAHVSQAGQAFPGQLAAWDDRFLPGLTRLAAGIAAAGGVATLQLHHGGRRGDARLSGVPVVAPWDDPAKRARALTTDEVERVVADFVAGAVRAERAGFHGVEVHGAHGYLVCQFLSPRNTRADRYGGSFENRRRMLWEVLRGIREATGPGFQLGLRLTPERSGIPLAEARALAADVLASGLLDYLDMSLWDAFKETHEEEHRDRLLIEHFTTLPRGATKLGVAGKITSAPDAAWCLDKGADFVLIGAGAVVHHDFPALALADPGFRLVHPRPREHFVAESVGPRFLDYLATQWTDFVS